ncbi:helix-turn-helix domain-containing protein [Bifidobacterium sp. ESL0764]|uniref:helix-turn-helix transcriptional regulator n=1 Tax=Bifidobacterium sp. ESL0764 TaxID=2983228 RepID=UPI0023F86028|nr:helix-turn-helix domain-containing protein [Bifidobacterium sp. ESL0764]WEV65608.1 helix-turn-helix domain-containing protein [Bifidobacterium sp. ESL0764]
MSKKGTKDAVIAASRTAQPTTDHIVDTITAQKYIGVSAGTLRNWRSRGLGPRYIKYGRMVRYRIADLNKYVEKHMVGGRR